MHTCCRVLGGAGICAVHRQPTIRSQYEVISSQMAFPRHRALGQTKARSSGFARPSRRSTSGSLLPWRDSFLHNLAADVTHGRARSSPQRILVLLQLNRMGVRAPSFQNHIRPSPISRCAALCDSIRRYTRTKILTQSTSIASFNRCAGLDCAVREMCTRVIHLLLHMKCQERVHLSALSSLCC